MSLMLGHMWFTGIWMLLSGALLLLVALWLARLLFPDFPHETESRNFELPPADSRGEKQP